MFSSVFFTVYNSWKARVFHGFLSPCWALLFYGPTLWYGKFQGCRTGLRYVALLWNGKFGAVYESAGWTNNFKGDSEQSGIAPFSISSFGVANFTP